MPTDPLQKVACNVLGRWLQSQMPDTDISNEWPDPEQTLPPRKVTILETGEPQDEQIQITADTDFTVIDAATGLYRWSVLARYQDLQLDVWSNYEPERNQLRYELDQALHKGELFTLGSGDPVRDGVLLRMTLDDDGFEGFIDYTFSGSRPIDDPGAIRRNEYRAMMTGKAGFILQVQAESARMARIKLALAINGGTRETLTVAP